MSSSVKEKEKKMSPGLRKMLANRAAKGLRISKTAQEVLGKDADAQQSQQAQPMLANLNASAPPFEPATTAPSTGYTPTAFTPYKPLAATRGWHIEPSQMPGQSGPAFGSAPYMTQTQQLSIPSGFSESPDTLFMKGAPRPKETKKKKEKKAKGEKEKAAKESKEPFISRSAGQPPTPTFDYLQRTEMPPVQLASPCQLLLLLDVNGTLVHRSKSSAGFTPRPGLEEFLAYCFNNHKVLLWSSAMPGTVQSISRNILNQEQKSQVVGVWARNTLGLSDRDYTAKVQVYKRLETVWNDDFVQQNHPGYGRGGFWGQHNTVLIDDSALKAVAQPFNHIEIPEFDKKSPKVDEKEVHVLAQVMAYLEAARCWTDVSGFIKHNPLVIKGAGIELAATVSAVEQGLSRGPRDEDDVMY